MDWHLLVAVDQMMVLRLGKLPLFLITFVPLHTTTSSIILGFTSTEYPFSEALQISAKYIIDSLRTKIVLILL